MLLCGVEGGEGERVCVWSDINTRIIYSDDFANIRLSQPVLQAQRRSGVSIHVPVDKQTDPQLHQDNYTPHTVQNRPVHVFGCFPTVYRVTARSKPQVTSDCGHYSCVECILTRCWPLPSHLMIQFEYILRMSCIVLSILMWISWPHPSQQHFWGWWEFCVEIDNLMLLCPQFSHANLWKSSPVRTESLIF